MRVVAVAADDWQLREEPRRREARSADRGFDDPQAAGQGTTDLVAEQIEPAVGLEPEELFSPTGPEFEMQRVIHDTAFQGCLRDLAPREPSVAPADGDLVDLGRRKSARLAGPFIDG